MSTCPRVFAVVVAISVLCCLGPGPALAQGCGENEPDAVEWSQTGDEGAELYRAVFTARGATLACFELLHPQYDQREVRDLPEGVPGWLSAIGPINLVTTWDAEFLPFRVSFLQLKNDKPIRRTLKSPTKTAVLEGYKAGETRTEPIDKLFAADPTYTLVSSSDSEAVYVWPDPLIDQSEVYIEKRYRKLDHYRIALYMTLYNFGADDLINQPQLEVHSWEAERSTRGFFSPAPNILEGLCMVGDGELEREDGSSLMEEPISPPGDARWVALGDRYFIKAAIARGVTEAGCALSALTNGVVSGVLYRRTPFTVYPAQEAGCYPDWYQSSQQLHRCSHICEKLGLAPEELFVPAVREQAYAKLKVQLDPGDADAILATLKSLGNYRGAVLYSYEFYLGPKDIDRLKDPDVGLEDSLDFWIVGIISKPMLHLLRWFHSIVPHWGLAIIMLTILVKLALLYWTQKSFTQMQRMAQLKPMMEELKTKYGKDKERLNQEMMNLYKREKVNPLGGCLPMLLQMPIWIALYRTIYASVDLFQAPLGLWIHDLSAPDPYFVFPVVLGLSMFFQQKLTPSTMDSAQAKMMLYMMPIMFTVFMLFLPSGLNLYILVNTVLSMLQQAYLRKQIGTPGAGTKTATA